MNLNKITTKAEFYEFSDIWYQRAHRLREIWQDLEETKIKRDRAYKLWVIMVRRVLYLQQVALRNNQITQPKNFEQGGVIVKANLKKDS